MLNDIKVQPYIYAQSTYLQVAPRSTYGSSGLLSISRQYQYSHHTATSRKIRGGTHQQTNVAPTIVVGSQTNSRTGSLKKDGASLYKWKHLMGKLHNRFGLNQF